MGAHDTKDELLQHYQEGTENQRAASVDGGSRCQRWKIVFVTAVTTATILHVAQTVHLMVHKECPPTQHCGSQCCALSQYCDSNSTTCADIPHFAGVGSCNHARNVDSQATWSVTCQGPALTMAPGEASAYDQMVLLGNPYPENATVAVQSMTSQMVDGMGNPVPLSELYVHHYVASIHFLLGEGSEIRGSALRRPFPHPYVYAIDGRRTASPQLRYTNIQLINTAGVAENDIKRCLECWCSDEAVNGSLVCCTQCPSALPAGSTKQYHLQHNVTYRVMDEAQALEAVPVSTIGFDVTGGEIEYDILQPNSANNTHTLVREVAVDYRCPQPAPFHLLRCSAHQHIGGQCIEVHDAATGQLLCRSCPKMGTQDGVPGDEKGYVVAMLDDDLWTDGRTPPLVQPGTVLRITSTYDGRKRLGVMALMTLWVADLQADCPEGFDFDSSRRHQNMLIEAPMMM